MEKILNISGKDIGFKASALIPRIYRNKTGRDLIVDMTIMQDYIKKEQPQAPELLEIFENLTYSMAYNYDNKIGSIDDFLGSIENIFDLYNKLPEILDIWVKTNETTSTPKN